MLRLAHIADSHFFVGSRFAECVRVHDFIVEDCANRKVDIALHAGDVYDKASTPEDRRAAARFFRMLAEVCPVVIVKGNHDVERDLEILSKLRTKHPIIVDEAAGVHVVKTAAGAAIVGCMAWPTKANVFAMAQGMLSREESEQIAQNAIRNILLGLGMQMDAMRERLDQAPKILLNHGMVRGSKTSCGQPLVGCDFEIGIDDLSLARADYYALGHIHMPQEWNALVGDSAPIVFPGSPRRTAYGEVEEKGYVVAEFDGPRCMDWERVPTPCAPMFLVEAEWDGAQLIYKESA